MASTTPEQKVDQTKTEETTTKNGKKRSGEPPKWWDPENFIPDPRPKKDLQVGDAFIQTTMWLINYLIIAKIAKDIYSTHKGKYAYILALSICLFVLNFGLKIMMTSHRNFYYGFLVFLLICVYIK